MTQLRLSILLAALALVGTLCAGQAAAQSGPSPATRPAVAAPVPVDANLMRYWSDPNQLRLKDTVGATDEEWNVLRPKINLVQKLQAQAGGRRMMMGGAMFVTALGGGAGEPSEVEKADAQLAKVLQDKNAKPEEEIKPALQDLREAKARAKAELQKAQKELRELLTARQEANLRQMGLFD